MNKIAHAKFGMGAAVLRKEDHAFITGSGCYTDDVHHENTLHGYVLRSPMAHARFVINDLEAARDMPGVHLVLVASDIGALKPLACSIPIKQPDGTMSRGRDIPVLCTDTVRHVGDALAFIVAETVDQAKDAAECIDIDFEILPAVVDTGGALEPSSVKVYDEDDGNLAFTHFMGDREKTDELFKQAHQVAEVNLINNRLVSNYMETRACLAFWDSTKERHDITVCSQGVFGIRRALAQVLDVDVEAIHVSTPDVGGGFGTKVFCYREYPLCMFAAKALGRPVKWTSDRTEHFTSDAQGRDNVVTARMAMDESSRFLAIDVDLIAGMGAYLHAYGPFIPYLGISMTTGIYDIPACLRMKSVAAT